VRDQDGIMWFNARDNSVQNMFNTNVGDGVNNGRLVRLDPKTLETQIFVPPANMSTVGDFLDWDGKGNIWMAGGAGVLRFDPKTKTFTDFKCPPIGSENGDSTSLYGVMGDKDGNGWWSEFSADREARVDAETGKIQLIDLPKNPEKEKDLYTAKERQVFAMQGNSGFFYGMPWGQGPRRPGADKYGDFVWVPGWWSHTLMKIDIHTAKVVGQYKMPTADAGSYMAQVDRDHQVWINYQNSGTISKFDPKTEKWTEYSLPAMGMETHQLGIYDHNGPTQIAIADERNSKIDRVRFRTKDELSALKAEVNQAQSASK
jgi:streptogramin lyase